MKAVAPWTAQFICESVAPLSTKAYSKVKFIVDWCINCYIKCKRQLRYYSCVGKVGTNLS
ncbi:hypothetical protein NIES4071_57560 [Calothrix sp. NIES-4071]|nr:hypothetical protein NIES4071_57560 [Calothrix sp. NIES-4071]BAZ60063.1 hypothetical protein NIES4105_57510 [Calothrix sp. NIES-4105]